PESRIRARWAAPMQPSVRKSAVVGYGWGWTCRVQLNGPNDVGVVGFCAAGSSTSFSHSSGHVLPCTRTPWKLGTFNVLSAGWLAQASLSHAFVDAPSSVVHVEPCTMGLSDRYTCESPLNSSTGLPKSVVCPAMFWMNWS